MARLNLYVSYDLTPETGGIDEPGEVGRTVYRDTEMLVVRDGPYLSFYIGTFTYSGSTGAWHGTINEVQFQHREQVLFNASGLSLDTRYFTGHATFEAALRAGFSGDDVMTGSAWADAIIGYTGDDEIRGGRGDDRIFGRDDADDLLGGAGRDLLNGGKGNDMLAGGDGDDWLVGAGGHDVFAFDRRDGRDVIDDFENGHDRIAMEGLRRFDALTITRAGDDVHVTYGDTEIVLQDTLIRAIDATDFGL